MNKPFKLLLLVSIGSVLSLLIGCSSSDEKKAKKMAVDYISEKYGFVPEISGVEFSQTGGGIVAKGIYATVFMKYNGTEFQVCVNYKDTDKPRTDNYEKDMFINDLKLFLKEHFSFDSMAVKIYCCNADFMVGTDIRSIPKKDKYALIMGNEGKGVSPSIGSLCDINLYIDMNDNVESLNVGVATSILLYEMRNK